MKTILLCSDTPNQRALAHRMQAVASLDSIGLIAIPPPKRRPRLTDRLAAISIARPLRTAWFGMLRHYSELFPNFPDVPVSHHLGVNATSVFQLIDDLKPELVIVSGTDLLRQPLIEHISRYARVMNVHTGISPYIKGGPNCTNWALALGEFDLIGNTVMWIDAGIDSGSIITTQRTPLTGKETLLELHLKVMDHAHQLLCQCVEAHRDGADLPAVEQASIDGGRIFYNRDWTWRPMTAAIRNFRRSFGPEAVALQRPLRLVPLPVSKSE